VYILLHIQVSRAPKELLAVFCWFYCGRVIHTTKSSFGALACILLLAMPFRK
jgi:hypothetical protein